MRVVDSVPSPNLCLAAPTNMTDDNDLVARARARADEARHKRNLARNELDAQSREKDRQRMSGDDCDVLLAAANTEIARLAEENLKLRRRIGSRPAHARTTDKATSAHAAELSAESADSQLGILARAYLTPAALDHGLTAAEAAQLTGLDGSWRRVSDLRRMGIIADTGTTRPNPNTGKPMTVDMITGSARRRLTQTWGWTAI